eukprot:CAMPEP_0197193964 /NCGR_PEP_ID=MMETSP1423-20130617/28375_1 /TAXON_ID=476441 /ORGANISM="Pseudo-nitzschia heimii, Strain UNC1101" /LENGTH=542 /DNA_ID=CAMNT_0042647301 /DNA_START=160 /DNA_END=1788 /DNA_ORIENTATION=-
MLSKAHWTTVLVAILLMVSMQTANAEEASTETLETEPEALGSDLVEGNIEVVDQDLCADDPYLNYLHFNANEGVTAFEDCQWVGLEPYDRCNLTATNGSQRQPKQTKAVPLDARSRAQRGRKQQQPLKLRDLCPLSCGLCPTSPLVPQTDRDGVAGISPDDLTTEQLEELDLSPEELEVVKEIVEEEHKHAKSRKRKKKEVKPCDCPDGNGGTVKHDKSSPTASPTATQDRQPPTGSGDSNTTPETTAPQQIATTVPTTSEPVDDTRPTPLPTGSPSSATTSTSTFSGTNSPTDGTPGTDSGPGPDTSRPTSLATTFPTAAATDGLTFAPTAASTAAATSGPTSATLGPTIASSSTNTWTSSFTSTSTMTWSSTSSTTFLTTAADRDDAAVSSVVEGQESSVNDKGVNRRTLAVVLSVVPILLLLLIFCCVRRSKMKKRARRKKLAAVEDTDDNSEYADEDGYRIPKAKSTDSIGSRFMKVLGYFNGRQDDERNNVKRCTSSLCDACDEHPHQIMSVDSYENAFAMSKVTDDDRYQVDEVEC